MESIHLFGAALGLGLTVIGAGLGIGRLVVFAVPTYFQAGARLEVLARSSKIYVEEFIDRFPLLRATRTLVGKFKRLMR